MIRSRHLAAMDRLNRYARNPHGRTMSRAIYAYKGRILGLADAAGWADHRMVAVEAPCWRCAVKASTLACWQCGGKGYRTVQFLQSTIWHDGERTGDWATGVTWLSPQGTDDPEVSAIVRRVHREGRPPEPLDVRLGQSSSESYYPAEVAADLLVLEALIGCDQDYRLYVGETETCAHPNWKDQQGNVWWLRCPHCDDRERSLASLTVASSIREWIERHPVPSCPDPDDIPF